MSANAAEAVRQRRHATLLLNQDDLLSTAFDHIYVQTSSRTVRATDGQRTGRPSRLVPGNPPP
jgi:hypothetical protein